MPGRCSASASPTWVARSRTSRCPTAPSSCARGWSRSSSTDEELETMNEELQSTNEELESINGELRASGTELDDANHFLESILTSFGSGVAVLNREMAVRVWNREAEDLWGLRADEVEGEH